jgi:Domain of unknown function (DUF4276)
MRAEHIEFLVEEPSMEAFLNAVLPKLVKESTFVVHAYQGKMDLMSKLGSRLRGYSKWLPKTTRVVVIVDRDNDDCLLLKQRMELEAKQASLTSRSTTASSQWQVATRIAIEELEAWYFGNWEAVSAAYPNVPADIARRAPYRESDKILGGTWEAFERILGKRNYFTTGLRKVEAAFEIGKHFDTEKCMSPSFMSLKFALSEAIQVQV